jgi:hypothetical protein
MREERIASIRPWLRDTHAPAFEAALEWLLPRCRTEEERILAPALLLLLSPFNALVVPCRPAPGSSVNFQVTLSRAGPDGPQRVRITLRAGSATLGANAEAVEADTEGCSVLPLDSELVKSEPFLCAARVIEALLVAPL